MHNLYKVVSLSLTRSSVISVGSLGSLVSWRMIKALLLFLCVLRRALKMRVSWPRRCITGSWPCGVMWSKRSRAHPSQPNQRSRSPPRTTATMTSPLTTAAAAARGTPPPAVRCITWGTSGEILRVIDKPEI